MTKQMMIINGQSVELTIHMIEGEVSEVYAVYNGQEIEFAYDLDEMSEKLSVSPYLNHEA